MKFESLRNFSYVGLGRVLGTTTTAAFYFILATILEPETYGIIGYVIALAGTASTISRFGLNQTVVVYKGKQKDSLSSNVNFLALLTIMAGSIVLVVFDPFAAMICFAMSIYIMQIHNILGTRQYRKHFLRTAIRNILFFILPLILYFVLDLEGILIGIALANLVPGLDYFRHVRFTKNLYSNIKTNLRQLIHNFSVDASINLPRTVDRILIAPLFGYVVVGIHHFNMQVLFALEIIPTVLYLFLLSEESSGIKHKKITYVMIFASIITGIVAVFASPIVISAFFPNFTDGIPALQIMVISIIPLTFASVFTAKLQASESTSIGYSLVARIGVLLGLVVYLGEKYGLVGLALSVLISSVVYAVFVAMLWKHNNRILE